MAQVLTKGEALGSDHEMITLQELTSAPRRDRS